MGNAGVPRGTKLGSRLFVLIIKDLCTTSVDDQFKFVDDVTKSESVLKSAPSNIQNAVTDIQVYGLRQIASDFTRKNAKNCALILKNRSSFPPIEVNREPPRSG